MNYMGSIHGYGFRLRVRVIFLQLLFGCNSLCGEQPQNSPQEDFGVENENSNSSPSEGLQCVGAQVVRAELRQGPGSCGP